MSGVRGCPTCGSGNALEATQCWVCGAALSAGAAPPQTSLARQERASSDSTQTWRLISWSAFLPAILTICALVGIEIALNWPGLLVPFALITLIVIGSLGRIAYVQLKRPPSMPGQGQGGGPKKGGTTGSEVLQGVALGLAIAAAIIAGMILLFVAMVVIFFILCLSLVATS